jgi:hypothetical protein
MNFIILIPYIKYYFKLTINLLLNSLYRNVFTKYFQVLHKLTQHKDKKIER